MNNQLKKSKSKAVLKLLAKSVHFKKPVTRSSFLSKSVVIFVIVILKKITILKEIRIA